MNDYRQDFNDWVDNEFDHQMLTEMMLLVDFDELKNRMKARMEMGHQLYGTTMFDRKPKWFYSEAMDELADFGVYNWGDANVEKYRD